jgi:hypothetical protein
MDGLWGILPVHGSEQGGWAGIELARRKFLRVGGNVFVGAAVTGLPGYASPEAKRRQGSGRAESRRGADGSEPILDDADIGNRVRDRDPFLAPQPLMWHDEDQEEVADVVRRSDNPVVDLQDIMIDPMNPELLLSDGLHPGLEEQRTTAAALVEQLGEGQGQ